MKHATFALASKEAGALSRAGGLVARGGLRLAGKALTVLPFLVAGYEAYNAAEGTGMGVFTDSLLKASFMPGIAETAVEIDKGFRVIAQDPRAEGSLLVDMYRRDLEYARQHETADQKNERAWRQYNDDIFRRMEAGEFDLPPARSTAATSGKSTKGQR